MVSPIHDPGFPSYMPYNKPTTRNSAMDARIARRLFVLASVEHLPPWLIMLTLRLCMIPPIFATMTFFTRTLMVVGLTHDLTGNIASIFPISHRVKIPHLRCTRRRNSLLITPHLRTSKCLLFPSTWMVRLSNGFNG